MMRSTPPRIDSSIRLINPVRISVGLPQHTDRVVEALRELGAQRG